MTNHGRPAELGTAGLGAIGVALSAALHLTQPQTLLVTGAVAVLPGAISFLVDSGGLVGAVRSLLVGRKSPKV